MQVVLRDIQTNLSKAVPDGESTVGREEHNGVQIDEASVSRTHAKIYNTDDGVFLEDLGSSNGTAIGGNAVGQSRMPVEIGAVIYFGNTAYKLERGKSEDDSGVIIPKGLKPVRHDRIDLRRATELIDLDKVHQKLTNEPAPSVVPGAVKPLKPQSTQDPQPRPDQEIQPARPVSELASRTQKPPASLARQTTATPVQNPQPAAPLQPRRAAVQTPQSPQSGSASAPASTVTPPRPQPPASSQPQGIFSEANKGTTYLVIAVSFLAGTTAGVLIGFIAARFLS